MTRTHTIAPNRFSLVVLSLLAMIAAAGFLFSASTTDASSSSTRYVPPPAWVLGPMQGWYGDESSINNILNNLDANQIPITVFHFDSNTWQTCPGNAQFAYSDALLNRLQSEHIRAVFWYVPLIGQTCSEYQTAATNHYFVEDGNGQPIVTSNFAGTGSWLDFNNPAAVTWWHSLLDQLFTRTAGVIGGFYIDNVRPDLADGASYNDAFTKDLLDYTRAHIPDGDVIMKRFGNNNPDDAFLTQYAHTAYVADLPTNFFGMQTGIKRVLKTSTLFPAPYNEFSGFESSLPDQETYIRRMQWGALQLVMENDPRLANFPWQAPYMSQALNIYQYYSTLHWELVPYLHSYDQAAYETNMPVFRNVDAGHYATGLGNEIYAAYVTNYWSQMQVKLPAGKWVNYWDESQTFQGPVTITQNVPLGQEPIYFLKGGIIPLQVRDRSTGHGSRFSVGSLTVNVFAGGHSTFRYYDPTGVWVTLDAQKEGNALTLCTIDAAPSQPLIYRVALWKKKPTTVTTSNGAVGVNRSWGSALPKLSSEQDVAASTGGWYYDKSQQHLIIKITTPGTDCP